MSDASRHPRILELPRDETDLATTPQALRRLQELLPAFLESFVSDAGADRAVVALDGGVDSAVTAALAAEALGPDAVIGLVMPVHKSHEVAARDAEAVASALGIEHRRCPLRQILAAFQEAVGEAGESADDFVALGNAQERFRMACAYYVANTADGVVVGSTNRTDRLLGTVTKYGETGTDCHLLGDLYRTEVAALAGDLGIPDELLGDSPQYGFEASERDADALGVRPVTLDRILRLHVDEGRGAEATADRLGVDPTAVERVAKWCRATRHKRHHPPKPSMES